MTTAGLIGLIVVFIFTAVISVATDGTGRVSSPCR